MRMITLMGTAAAALTAAMVFAAPANADRICRQVCNDDGFCRSRCFDNGDRLYLSDRDRDGYYQHRRPGVEFHVPGANVEIGR
jgi:hypothetical protein